MSYLDPLGGDLGFVAAAYGVILGGVGLYAIALVRRLQRARGASLETKAEPHPSASPDPPVGPGA